MTETATTSFDNDAGSICIHCGLCCDGSLFGKTVIRIDDDPAFLNELGVEVITRENNRLFRQPCIWLTGSTCTLYHDQRRFRTCKSFQCKLFKQYLANEISYEAALVIIREVLTRRESVKELSELLQISADSRIFTLLRELKQSGKMDDLSFRRTYARQLLDSVILGNLINQRFYKEEGTTAESCTSEEPSP